MKNMKLSQVTAIICGVLVLAFVVYGFSMLDGDVFSSVKGLIPSLSAFVIPVFVYLFGWHYLDKFLRAKALTVAPSPLSSTRKVLSLVELVLGCLWIVVSFVPVGFTTILFGLIWEYRENASYLKLAVVLISLSLALIGFITYRSKIYSLGAEFKGYMYRARITLYLLILILMFFDIKPSF